METKMHKSNARKSMEMSQPKPTNPSQHPRSTLPTLDRQSLLTQDQLIDSLTAHISLYHSQSNSLSKPNPNSNRSSILKWFSSLTVHQRQSHLTTVDYKSTQLLIMMHSKLRSHGPGRFIILPDLPDGDLPSLCYKQSRGLLSRVAESDEAERVVCGSVRLFGSREGENVGDCSCSVKFLDSMTVGEDLVEDVDMFVGIMDKVSGGGFLRGEEGELGSDWVELEWLKGRGYYSVGAFVANRLEVGLRLAWMSCCGSGKKRGVKLKDKVASAGVAANVFWRKKGCVDWWRSLGDNRRKNVLNAVLGKTAESLICEILNEVSNASEDGLSLFRLEAGQSRRYIKSDSLQSKTRKVLPNAEFGLAIRTASVPLKATSYETFLNRLSVLENVVELMSPSWHCEYQASNVFYCTLGSVGSIIGFILRKLRGLFMVISLDCTNLELLGEGNSKELSKRPLEKPVASSRRKKGKPQTIKKTNTKLKTGIDESSFDGSVKACSSKTNSMNHSEMPGVCHGSEITSEKSSCAIEMEPSQALVLGKGQAVARKNRKGKNKKSRCKSSVELKETQEAVKDPPCFLHISSDEIATIDGGSDNLTNPGMSNKNIIGTDTQALKRCHSGSSYEGIKNNFNNKDTQNHLIACTESACHASPEYHSSDSIIGDQTVPPGVESLSCKPEFNGISDVVPDLEFGTSFSSNGTNLQIENTGAKSNGVDTLFKADAVGLKGESTVMDEQMNKNFYDTGFASPTPCLSYEWPSLAPVYFQSVNSHILPAADRLHLDVGHNRYNHIRQPYVPTVHKVRNSRIEGSRSRMLSRPLPMSLDWPPMVRSGSGLAPSLTCNYDSEFISRRQTAFAQSYSANGAQKVQFGTMAIDDQRKYSGDTVDLPETASGPELMDESDGHWMSEDELEMHTVSAIDYNKYFGGGVMYWNPSDQPGSGFSRPPSLSSDDSMWAWHEADMNRAVDDMVAFSSSYSTNGLTSPPATSFCSPFDQLGSGHQALGYAVSGNEVSGKVLHASSMTADAATDEVSGSLTNLAGDIEGKTADSLPYPILRPIIIPNMSRERTIKSPCIPANRQEPPRIKRPPSPIVLCVPRAPRPPPPSPVSDSRKHRGFPIVRSGSSSPRHWGMRGWYRDGINLEEVCVRMDGPEVVWPPWRNKNLSAAHAMIQPLPGALLQDRLFAMSQLARDQEHPDVSFPLQPPELENSPTQKASLSLIHSLLHDEIDLFCNQVAAANMARKPFINWAVKRVARSLQVLWPRSRTNIYGSNATGLSLPTSDVDLVVCLPPVRNLEPIKEAGILEGRNGIKETCLQHAARYLANQEWVKNDSLRTVENTAIPIIMLVVEVPDDLVTSVCNVQSTEETSCLTVEQDDCVQSVVVGLGDSLSPKFPHINRDGMKGVKSIRLDISFKTPSHTGLQTTELVKALTEQFPAATPLALVLKQFLADRSLDQSYSGGLSSYCLVLLITRFLQHVHHLGRPINQNVGSLLMDFLYFFGNMFDPRQIRISVQGSGVYINRERGYSIDPLYIDDPLFPTNNVGRNCFRIHQCIKAFAEAYSTLENELADLDDGGDTCLRPSYRLLSKIIPSINLVKGTRLCGDFRFKSGKCAALCFPPEPLKLKTFQECQTIAFLDRANHTVMEF